MTNWAIDDVRLAAAITAARGREPASAAQFDELVARAIWGVLVEPGDTEAGALIAAIGAVEAAKLMISGASATRLREAADGGIARGGEGRAQRRWSTRLRSDDVVRSLERAGQVGARMLVPGDDEWPTMLDDLGTGAPVLLWVQGDARLLHRPAIAMVGARAATGYGEHVAMEFAAGLVARDAAIVSGGAYGIDGMAHRAALASGGTTLAVLAGGVDRLYPSGHEALLRRIAQQGVLVSETPCGTSPTKWRFLQRNRVIAALAHATVVVEAGYRSGALNTAHHAQTIGRPLGVVPGPITSASSAGCHRMLRDENAHCVTSVADIMQLAFGTDRVLALPGFDATPIAATAQAQGVARSTEHAAPESSLETRVLDAVRPRRGQSADEVARAAGESPESVRAVLGVLALDGRVQFGDDGLWRSIQRPRQAREPR